MNRSSTAQHKLRQAGVAWEPAVQSASPAAHALGWLTGTIAT